MGKQMFIEEISNMDMFIVGVDAAGTVLLELYGQARQNLEGEDAEKAKAFMQAFMDNLGKLKGI